MSKDNFDGEFDDSLPSGPCHPMARRFRGYLPIAVDVETGGFDSVTDVLLEIAATIVGMDKKDFLFLEHTYFLHTESFEDTSIKPATLEFTGIELDHPLRMTVQEETALTEIFCGIHKTLRANGCKRTILVGHNSSFGLGFLNAAVVRTGIKHNPFRPFSNFDTATLAGLACGQAVLVKAYQTAGMEFNNHEAYSAHYNTEEIVELFCGIVNRWKGMGSWMDNDD